MRKSMRKGLALVLSAALALGAPVAAGTQTAKAATTPTIVEVTETMSDVKDTVDAPTWASGISNYYKLTGDFDVTFDLTLDDMSKITQQPYWSPVLGVTDEAGATGVLPQSADEAKYILLRCDYYGWQGGHTNSTNNNKSLFEFTKKWDVDSADWRSAMQNSDSSFSVNVKRAGQKFDVDWKLINGDKTFEQSGTSSSLDLADSICLFMIGDNCKFTINSVDYKTATAEEPSTGDTATGGAVSGGATSGSTATGGAVSGGATDTKPSQPSTTDPNAGNKPDPNESFTVGAADKSSAFWSEFSKSYEIVDGESMTIEFNIISDMADLWNAYVMAFTNQSDLNEATRGENYKEYAVIRADRWCWGGGDNKSLSGADITYEGGELGTDELNTAFKEVMKNAKVTLDVSRSGKVVTIKSHAVSNTDATKTYDLTSKFELGDGKDDDGLGTAFITLTIDHSYIYKNVDAPTVDTGDNNQGTTDNEEPSTTTKKKSIKITGVKAKGKKVTGKVSVKKATVKVKVGKAKFKKAKVSGKKFTFTVKKKMKKGTKVVIKATKKNYKTKKKTVKAKKA